MDSDFGKRLKKLRSDAGFTQQQLAERMGVTKSVVSFYELRERTPSPEIVIKLCEIFHVSADYLLGIARTDTMDISGLTEEDKHILRILTDHLRMKNSS